MDEVPTGSIDVARTYYRALDEQDYDLLARLLAPEFVQERPDRTLDGRERFVEFMRDERPQTDTTHRIEGIYQPLAGENTGSGPAAPTEVVVRGQLLDSEGEGITGFVDVFAFEGENVSRLVTYTD